MGESLRQQCGGPIRRKGHWRIFNFNDFSLYEQASYEQAPHGRVSYR